MTNATVEDPRNKRRAIQGEGDQTSLSPLPEFGLRDASVELHCGDPAEVGAGGGGGTSPPVPLYLGGHIDGLHDQLPQGVSQRWMSFAGLEVAQILADYWLWEAVLNDEERTGIVELGTGTGGFSLYLSAQAEARGISFRTYDVIAPVRRIPGFVQCDIYANATDIGLHLQRRDPIVLFCDGGNKPRELKTFSKYLSSKSLIVVHDWGTEMLRKDVPENVVEVYGQMCDEIGSMSRCFQVQE